MEKPCKNPSKKQILLMNISHVNLRTFNNVIYLPLIVGCVIHKVHFALGIIWINITFSSHRVI